MSEPSTRHVVVLYNTDYDDELIAAADVSAVRESARAITRAVADCGHDAELVGIHGHDLGDLIARLRQRPPALVFNLCESLAGDARNEAVIPAVLDMLGVPYTGTDALGLGSCLHKERAKDVLIARGVATPAYRLLRDPDHARELLGAGELDRLAYPYFVKLAHEDASIGIDENSRVERADALVARVEALYARYRQPVIAERYIAGREVNVTVMGNDAITLLPLHEIDFAAMPEGRPHIVSYAAKWDEDHVDYAGTLPRPLGPVSAAVEAAIRRTAGAAYRALGVRDFGRVDLRVDDAGEPWVIDVNPNCDLSPDAGVARAAAHAGIAYPELIGRICDISWRRHGTAHHRGG